MKISAISEGNDVVCLLITAETSNLWFGALEDYV